MFELTNEQLKCFGLLPVEKYWHKMELKASPHDNFHTFVYFKNNIIKKCITVGDKRYTEAEMYEEVSEDIKYLLPKTKKGKPKRLTVSAFLKRRGKGMKLSYIGNYITLYNENTECDYYSSAYEQTKPDNLDNFIEWVEKWSADTTIKDIEAITEFSHRKRKHVKYNEGDVFRFKINRRLYGYGRIILNYDKMRKQKEPFWDILMCKPLVCSVYHIVTENKNLKVDDIKDLKSLPSCIIADNALFYGEYEVIGNIPIKEQEDYPIMCGRMDLREKTAYLQCGKLYRKIENTDAIPCGFINNSVCFHANVRIDILIECIEKNSNLPYWNNYYPFIVESDLRNPKFKKEFEQICRLFDVSLVYKDI